MDVNSTETLDVNTLGGADTVTVNDLTGTNVNQVNIDLGVNGAPTMRSIRSLSTRPRAMT